MVNVNHYEKEIECIYKEEKYSVRDNGGVLRHSIEEKRARPTDNNWTFGKLNSKSGYLEIASVRIHRIVATAFNGEPPTKEHVVDHIDTNKQNNRPDNLRWVTRLENILLNPITARRIEIVCGSVEAFLADPSKFRDKLPDPNYEWMCAVSAEEAQVSLERMQSWAKSNKPLHGGSLGEWIFNREIVQTPPATQPNYIMSKTPNAAQRIFTTNDKPNEYPSTPQAFKGNPLTVYYDSLTEGATFFRNHNGEYIVVKSGFSKDGNTLYVMTKSAYVWEEQEDGEYIPVPIAELPEKVSNMDLPHSLTEITYEDGLFVHAKMELGFHPTEELEELFANYTEGYNGLHSKERIEDIFKQVEKKTGISRQALCSNKAMRGDYYEARKYAVKLLQSELNLLDYEISKLIGLSTSTVKLYLEVCADRYSRDHVEVQEKEFKNRFDITPQNFIQKNWGAQSEFPCCPQKVLNDPIAVYAAQLEVNSIFFQNSYYFTTVIQSAIIDKGKSLLVMYKITKKESVDKRWGIMKITFQNEKFVYEIIPNYNDTLEHYWLKDVENHFNCIIEGSDWSPLYDSQGREFKGDYMPL